MLAAMFEVAMASCCQLRVGRQAFILSWLLIFADGTGRATDILLNHDDGANDGQNLTETTLTPGNVSSSTFGKLFTTALDGPDAVQPLVKTGVNITTGPYAGVHDAVFVCTENDSVYAIDAASGLVLWKTNLLHSFHGGTPTIRTGWWSITDTPAIDPTTGVLYVESSEVENGNSLHVLSALNIADGSFYANQMLIAEGTSTPSYVSGPTTASGKKFDAYDLSCRCLTLNPVNRVVYFGFGAPGTPVSNFNGWIVGYSEAKDESNNLPLAASWCASPNGQLVGIWQSAGPMAVDPAGDLFVETGDGYFETSMVTPGYVSDGRLTSLTNNATIPGGLKVPSLGDYGDSVVKLTPDSDTSQQSDNPNGFGLHVADFFSPKNEQTISYMDGDLGSSSPVLLPDSVGSAGHPHLLVGNDKQGNIFLLDRINLGGYHGDAAGDGASGTNNVVQELDAATHGAWCTGAFFAAGSTSGGTIYYVTAAYGESQGQGDVAKAFSIANGQISPTPASTSTSSYGPYSYPGSTPQVSANGGTNGILWTIDRVPGLLIAYDATNLRAVLFRSDTLAANNLSGAIYNFHAPAIANGRVYVGTSTSLNAYGLYSNFSTWAAQQGLIGNNALPATVVSHDGIANLMKYALGLNPFTTYNSDSSSLPSVKIQTVTGSSYLALNFDGVAPGVTYNAEASSDLVNWTTIQSFTGTPPPGSISVQDTQPVSASARRFMRLQVSQ